jgi:UDP-N-acetylmuramoyl-L-alanyl-D-glutamate--2,6-diaminopimelate ligase
MENAAEIVSWLLHRGLSSPGLAEALGRARRLDVDSRKVGPESGFIAIRGANHDGHAFLDAVAKTAAFVVVEKSYRNAAPFPPALPVLRVDDTLEFSRDFASVFHGHPSRDLRILGITGTNGKTTSTFLLEALSRAEGRKPGVIGTIEVRYGGQAHPAANTTPDAVELQAILSDMRMAGVDTVCMEISSHALHQGRVRDLQLDSLIITNLTPDHLDYHATMEAYLEAKLLGFDLLHESEKVAKRACVWAGIDRREVLMGRLQGRNFETRVFGIDPQGFTGLSFRVGEQSFRGSAGTLLWRGEPIWEGTLNLVGDFNILNTLGCLASWLHTGNPLKQLREQAALGMDAINRVQIPGRLEPIPSPKGGMVFVDYAHTPDALENILQTLGRLPHKRLLCVFGCGGDRDQTKRPVMGRIAGRAADFTWVTSDNPRTEDPASILAMIEGGIREVSSAYRVVENREEAIQLAAESLGEGEILVIAGKGHEDYQILGKRKIHFDDRELARKYLRA